MAAIAGSAILLVSLAPLAVADEEEQSVRLNGGSTALGVGGNWGEGVLTFNGYQYPFSVRGLAIGDVGITAFTASGVVFNAQRPEDVDGNYVGVSAGLTLAGGASAVTLRNQHGVTMNLIVTTRGLGVDLAGRGIAVSIPESSFAAVRAQQAAETAAARADNAAQRIDAAADRVESATARVERTVDEMERSGGTRRARAASPSSTAGTSSATPQ
jgi:hypothetical protein